MNTRAKPRQRQNQVVVRVLSMALWCAGIVACGDEEPPPPDPAKANAAKKKVESPEPDAGAAAGEEGEGVRPAERASRILTRDDFGVTARDPFENFQMPQVADAPVEPEYVRQRDVRMPNYNFEDLKLVAIVRSGASIRPRALFVGSDGISKPIAQGEYFSRNEVLLATVNSDYIEIEIVDEELAKDLNMARGERRAIYLKQD